MRSTQLLKVPTCYVPKMQPSLEITAPAITISFRGTGISATGHSVLCGILPIIFIASGDPVGDGLVQSLAHPGGNLTGFAVMEPSLGAKLLGMLKQVAPHVARVAIMVNPDNAA